jgi:phosphonate transport system substrate-binding protein
MISRRLLAKAGASLSVVALLALAGCGKPKEEDKNVLNFSILSAENQQSMQPLWQPLLDDLKKETGITAKPFFASNYTALITAMKYKQVQVGWFSALPALEAVNRADGEVLGRVIDKSGSGSYNSVIIVRKGSGITVADLLKCGKRYNFGMGDAESTSGTLAPLYYLFIPNNVDPDTCFKTVKSASHQANMGAVANGILDVATNNSVGLVFARRENPAMVDKTEVIWTSPDLPESGIVVRKDMDPAIKEKLRSFFLTYGTAPGPEGDRQRKVLADLEYGGFKPADDSYLDPVRKMKAAKALVDAKKSGNAAAIAEAQKVLDDLRARVPDAPATVPAQ